MPLFKHRNGRVVDYPLHFKDAKIGRNLTLIEDEVETDKVVLENSPNSQTRVGRKVKDSAPIETETIPDTESGESDSD